VKDEDPASTDGSPEASRTDSPFAALLAEIAAVSDQRRDEILASFPEEKRRKMIAALGSLRSMSPADVRAAVAHDRDWAAGLPLWKRRLARLILAVTEKFLGSRSG